MSVIAVDDQAADVHETQVRASQLPKLKSGALLLSVHDPDLLRRELNAVQRLVVLLHEKPDDAYFSPGWFAASSFHSAEATGALAANLAERIATTGLAPFTSSSSSSSSPSPPSSFDLPSLTTFASAVTRALCLLHHRRVGQTLGGVQVWQRAPGPYASGPEHPVRAGGASDGAVRPTSLWCARVTSKTCFDG